MNAQDVAAAAEAFLSGLASFDGRLKARDVVLNRDAGRFSDIFRDTVPSRSGVYWFFLPNGAVFDIGRSDGIWGRILLKAGVAFWKGDPSVAHEGTVGDGWGFPNSHHRSGRTVGDAISKGEFHVGWIAVEPTYVAYLVEVYLQTLCQAADGKLPEFCLRIG